MGRYSLIVVASLILLLVFFVISMINTGSVSLHRNIEAYEYNHARNLANSAAQLIIKNIINHNSGWDFSSSSYPNGIIANHPMQSYEEWTELQGKYKIKEIEKDDDDLMVTVSGESNDRVYDIVVQFRLMPVKQNMFDYAAYSKTDFTIGNQGTIDSFHPDDPDDFNANAIVGYGTNGVFTNNGTLNGSAVREDRVYSPMVDPGGGTPLVIPNSSTTITAGEWRVSGNINLSGNTTITIADSTTLYVDGDITTTGNAQIYINPGASLTIFLNGSLNTQGNGIYNATGQAKNLLIYGTEDCDLIVDLQGSNNSSFVGAIYAPYAKIVVRGGNNYSVRGAIVGNEIEIYRGLFYDESLGEFGADLSAVTTNRYSVLIWE